MYTENYKPQTIDEARTINKAAPLPFHIDLAKRVAKDIVENGAGGKEVAECLSEIKNILCQKLVDKIEGSKKEAEYCSKELDIIRNA